MPLGKRNDCGEAKYAGVQVDRCTSLTDTARACLTCGFDFVLAPLVNSSPEDASRPDTPGSIEPPFPVNSVVISDLQWSNQAVGCLSQWIACDSSDAHLAAISCKQLQKELEWASHLSLQAVVLPPLQPEDVAANFSQVILRTLEGLNNTSLWLPVSLVEAHPRPPENVVTDAPPTAAPCKGPPAGPSESSSVDPWEQWDRIRSMCEYHPRLGVMLELHEDLPPQVELERWSGEPVRAVTIPPTAFITNGKGYPVLPKAHQRFITHLMQRTVQVVLRCEGDGTIPANQAAVVIGPDGEVGQDHPLRPYWEYLSYLFRRQDALSDEEQAEANYRDYLQAPLQPLQDNLESTTYETFERDDAKYDAYQEAVYRALLDRVPDSEASSTVTVLMVVGAGRGPLVRASIRAAERAQRQLKVYALEKNPNALISIHQMVAREGWQDLVTIVGADMRRWQAPQQADILVSELLGSFGDNELSPECLDGAQQFLKEDGISIPCSYTSYLQPVTTHKLWSDVKGYKDLEHFETPYVVKLWRCAALAPVLPVFSFHHPNIAENIDNSRSIKLCFDRKGRPAALCHGFAGYFDTQLYKDVVLSIHPDTHTPGMFSWFPIYFPLRSPMNLPADTDMEVHMWRCVRTHKVWYEWAVAKPAASPIHNPSGRSYHVGL